jgi:hypothetical protein
VIYISCALYKEAEPLIKKLQLKPASDINAAGKYCRNIFKNEAALLILTGSGNLTSAICLSETLSVMEIKKCDTFINFGSAAGTPGMTGLYFGHKLTETPSGRTFYPDMIYADALIAPEAEVFTVPVPYVAEDSKLLEREESSTSAIAEDLKLLEREESPISVTCRLYDMEAASVYQVAERHFSQENIFILKYVTDNGVHTGKLSKDVSDDSSVAGGSQNIKDACIQGRAISKISSMTGDDNKKISSSEPKLNLSEGMINLTPTPEVTELILKFINELISKEELKKASDKSDKENLKSDSELSRLADKLSELFSASETMKSDIYKLLLYRELAFEDALAFVETFLNEYNLTEPVVRKKGKELLINFRERIIG